MAFAVLALASSPARAADPWPMDDGDAGSAVVVTKPDDQSTTVGTVIEPLQVKATDSGSGRMLTFTATGLPAGLSISTVIGSISGTPTTAGTSTVTVTVTDGTAVRGSASFTWTVAATPEIRKPVNGTAYTIQLAGTTNVIDNPGSSRASGKQMVIYERHNGSNLKWTALVNADGTYSFRNGTSQLCLAVRNASAAIGAAIIQAECSTASNQNWNLVVSGAGFKLVNAGSGLAVGCVSALSRTPLTQQASGSEWEFRRAG